MARVSRTFMIAIAAALAALFWPFLSFGQDPTGVLGTDGADYRLFTPQQVVEAGGGASGGLPALSGHAGEFLRVNPEATAADWEAVPSPLPALAGQGGKHLSVNTAETATEWVTPPAGPRSYGGAGAAPASAAAAGSALTVSRSDHVHPYQPLSAFGTVGTSGQCAKANSGRNGLSYGDCGSPRALATLNPKVDGTVSPGTRTDVSRSDHVHPTQIPALTGKGGDCLAANSGATALEFKSCGGGGGGSGVVLSDNTPQPPGPPVPGGGGKASRDDHVHAPPLLSEVTPKANAGGGNPGRNVIASRDDHVHPAAIPSLTGNAKAVLSVKADASGSEWVHPTTVILEGAGIQAADKGKLIAANSAGNGIALTTPHDAVLAGLPSLTGNGGKCVKANSGATGVEFGDCGGGNGGGSAGIEWKLLFKFSSAVLAKRYQFIRPAWTQALADQCTNADFIALAKLNSNSVLTGPWGRYSTDTAFLTNLWPAPFASTFESIFLEGCDGAFDGKFRITLDAGEGKTFTEGEGPFYIFTGRVTGGGGGGSTNPTVPAPTAAGKLKHLRVNAAGAAYELADPPPDLSDEVEDNEGSIEHLDAVTSDLIAGDPPAGWTDSPDSATAAIWLAASIPSLAEARAGTYAASITSGGFDTKVIVVRLPATTSAARARVAIAGVGANAAGVNELVTGYRLLGASADGSFKYYRDSLALGSAVTAVKMQTTTAAHVGTSQYEGLPTRVKGWAIKGSGLPVPVESLPFATPWAKLYEGNFSGTGQINIALPNAAGPAIIAAQRDTEGAGVYRQFMVQFAWNVGTGADEELVQTQALLPGVPLDGSVGQATQGLRYYGVLPGLDAVCPIFLKASSTAAALLGNGSCQPDWGNQGNAHPTVFWKLWGRR